MRTVYMPKTYDDECWQSSPDHWRDRLREDGLIAEDGTAEFLVADILGSADVVMNIDDDGPEAPEGTNFVVTLCDGDPCDQGDTVDAVVSNTREAMRDWDWPMPFTFVFWRHHDKTQRLQVARHETK